MINRFDTKGRLDGRTHGSAPTKTVRFFAYAQNDRKRYKMKRFFSVFFRALIIAGALVLLGTFIFTLSIGILNVGNIAGAALCVWLILVCIKPLHLAIKRGFHRFFLTRFLYRIVSVTFIVLLCYGAVATAAIIGASMIPPKDNATAVVLGAQVRPTGEPSTILRGRINAAENYLIKNNGSSAVLSGGKGTDEVKSEAQCMYDVMTADGISSDRLYIEEKSTTTRENFELSEKIIEEKKLNPNLAVTTDRFHQLRARIITMQLGIKGEVGAVNSDAPFKYVPTYMVREWFALPYQIFKS